MIGDEPVIPQRELRDPRALRAFAHPLRLRLIEELAFAGSATATELSERVGESPASCSWHLRQLARYGFIEEADGGPGRTRPWRVVIENTSFGGRESESDPELVRAGDAAEAVLLERHFEAVRAWGQRRRADPPAWRDAASVGSAICWLTAEELAAFQNDIGDVVERHLHTRMDRVDSALRPPGTRPIRFVQWAIPAGGEETETPGSAGEESREDTHEQ